MINLDVVQPKKVYLRDDEVLRFREFIDQSSWSLLKEYWGYKQEGGWGRNNWERQPYYLAYSMKDVRDYIKVCKQAEK